MVNKFSFYFCFIFLIIPVLADEIVNAQYGTNYIEINGPENIFELNAIGTGGYVIDPVTNITASKKLEPSNQANSPDVVLTIKMPPKPAKLDIVLAMDTSGSMVQHYQENNPHITYYDWALNAIAPIIEMYPDARISIVSWDDENEATDTKTPFFNAVSDKLLIERNLSKLENECIETDNTIYSIGIKRAVEVLDDKRNWPDDPFNTARIIIFVTGLSEFRAEPANSPKNLSMDYQLENARYNRSYENVSASFNGYQIFPVRIGISGKFPMEYENLSRILNETRISNQPAIIEPVSIEDLGDLKVAIEQILEGLKSRPVAYDVIVEDTLPSYLEYLSSENNKNISAFWSKNPSDNTTYMKWLIGTMKGNETWKGVIHTNLALDLPVELANEISNDKNATAYSIPISRIGYNWMTGYRGSINLPEGGLLFSSGS